MPFHFAAQFKPVGSLDHLLHGFAMVGYLGVDLFFAPEAASMYPAGFVTTVVVDQLSEPLEGAVRGAAHFRGVATVVAKLLLQVAPDFALFGEKDFQQLKVVTAMARDLDIPTKIVGAPTVREADDRSVLEMALIENLQRENLNLMEEALGYSELVDRFNLRQ